MDDIPVDRHEVVIRSRDKQIGLRLPLAVDQRIGALLARATKAGERTNRKELIAALLATAELSGEAVGHMLRRYRTSKVGDVLLDRDDSGTNVVELVSHRPGPRTAR